jgi:hypothetical protein
MADIFSYVECYDVLVKNVNLSKKFEDMCAQRIEKGKFWGSKITFNSDVEDWIHVESDMGVLSGRLRDDLIGQTVYGLFRKLIHNQIECPLCKHLPENMTHCPYCNNVGHFDILTYDYCIRESVVSGAYEIKCDPNYSVTETGIHYKIMLEDSSGVVNTTNAFTTQNDRDLQNSLLILVLKEHARLESIKSDISQGMYKIRLDPVG